MLTHLLDVAAHLLEERCLLFVIWVGLLLEVALRSASESTCMLVRAMGIGSHAFRFAQQRPSRGGEVRVTGLRTHPVAGHASLHKHSLTYQFIDVLLPELVADVVRHRRCMFLVRTPEVWSPSAGATNPPASSKGHNMWIGQR